MLTGVRTAEDLLRAPEHQRPEHVGADLTSLDRTPDELAPGPRDGWDVRRDDGDLVVAGGPDGEIGTEDVIEALRAACVVAWDGPTVDAVRAEGAAAEQVLARWREHRIG